MSCRVLQFFLCTVATPWLDGKHVVFGQVTNGLDVVSQQAGRQAERCKSCTAAHIVADMQCRSMDHCMVWQCEG